MNTKILLILAISWCVCAQEAVVPDLEDTPETTTTPKTTTSTTTPKTTTSTTPKTTTTPETTTSTSTPETTTSSTTSSTTPKTTTTAPTTQAPPVPSHYLYNVTENNVTCIMFDGKISFKVTYNIGANNTNTSVVEVPKPSTNVMVDGSCQSSDGTQYIKVSWGPSLSPNNIMMTFEESADKKSWRVANVNSTIVLSPKQFVNATDEGKSLETDYVVKTAPSEIAVNHSLKCFSSQTFDNSTTTTESGPYPYSVILMIDGIQIQAFNKISHQNKFVEEVHCDADRIADVVPIAVGCALAALIVIVLIAYIIGRRRRSAAYQSV